MARDGGSPPLSSAATVFIIVTNTVSKILPVWQSINTSFSPFVAIDDLTSTVQVLENATYGTLVTTNVNLAAIPYSGSPMVSVRYYITTDGKPRLNLNNDLNIPPQQNINPYMPIQVNQRPLDASLIWLYILRCRAYVSIL